ncbi:MAG: formate dehydrogenase, partial [Marinobacter sp.]|nr:formate dehydrogenase [Marinobacter sp.]
MGTKIYVPCDTTALSVGADEVAAAIQTEAARRGLSIDLVRNGSRALFWLETLVEVDTGAGRVGYGPVEPEDVPGLFDAGLADGTQDHPLALGDIEQHPYLTQQQRLTFSRIGRT